MKSILLSAILLIMYTVQSAYARPNHYDPYDLSTLEIKSQGAGYISVSVDDQLYPNQTKLFSLSHLNPGNHYIEIFTDRIVYHGYYAVSERMRIFAGNVYIQPASLIKGAVDHNGRFFIKDVDPLVLHHPQEPAYYPYEPNVPYHPEYYTPLPMHAADFNNLLKVIGDQWYDETRLSVALQALSSNNFTSQQVVSIMDKFWFEDTKLEFAKAAFPKVIDQSNYFIVNKEFWYSSSVEELNEYLSHHYH